MTFSRMERAVEAHSGESMRVLTGGASTSPVTQVRATRGPSILTSPLSTAVSWRHVGTTTASGEGND
jgi:hypothetical protein